MNLLAKQKQTHRLRKQTVLPKRKGRGNFPKLGVWN